MGLILLLSGCNLNPLLSSPPPGVPAVAMPPSLRAEDIVGRWGLAAYHRDQDRARTIVAARDQCTQAFLIDRSPGGNILMFGHDNPQLQEMIVKGSSEGKTYIGPGPYPGIEDREVVSFDGKVLILKWVNSGSRGATASWCWRAVAPQRPSKSPRRDSPTSLDPRCIHLGLRPRLSLKKINRCTRQNRSHSAGQIYRRRLARAGGNIGFR
jgi:hypothetical protein